MLTEKLIQKALFHNFYSHEFKFTNVFYFHNESDWLSFLPSGYCYEIEIKISRADFKKDFAKPRHQIHKSSTNGSKYYTQRGRTEVLRNPSWELCRAFPELIESREYRGYSRRSAMDMEVHYWMDISSEIIIKERRNESLPNKFFYAVPEGLIKKEEVPDYAGLLFITEDGSVKKVKDGKFIHKDTLDPKKLFQKTYYAYLSKLSEKLNNQ